MIIGHQRVLDFLKKSVKKNRLAHAYLFTGPAYLGKQTVALEFIRMLIGKEIDKILHPDVLIIKPEVIETDKGIKKEMEIGIKQAREIQHQMSLSPYSADYKIVLIDGVDKMTNEATNCLLKTLEEPNGKAILILIASNPKMLLPTIISRCQIVNFLPVPEEEIKKAIPKADDRIIRLANGRPGLVINYLENPELLKIQEDVISKLEKILKSNLSERYEYVEEISKDIPMCRKILDYWLFWFRDLLLLSNNCSDLIIYSETSKYKDCYSILKLKKIIETIKKTNWLLTNPSINTRLALEVLMLEI
ncbi:MAG: AAA family ATPase [Candidatus Portnoybacteria bacterium]|nr:AAA family ATPase [Candidatus Portnoybacteria bacterium]